jgi:hypothetical protein
MNGRLSALLVALFVVAGSMLFLNRAWENGQKVNTRISRTDQGAYIKQGILMRESDFGYVTPRNRMPLYPGLLALFMDKEELAQARREYPEDKAFSKAVSEAFFDTGKRINVTLAFAGAVLAGVIFFRKFPRHHALNLTALAAFTVLLFKAPYVQAEILYYTLTFAVFVLCWRLFSRPSWWVALVAGGLVGLSHLTKASVLPGLLVVLVFLPLDALWQRWKDGRSPVGKIAATLIVVGVFLAVVYPYIARSKQIFGHYFYNVNSTFYMWCDSWEEATSRTREAGDRKGWPDLPPDQIPSFSNYLKTHTAGEIVWRVVKGVSVVFNSMMKSYGYLGICLAYLAFAVFLLAWKWRLVWRLFCRRPFPFLALLAYFGGYYLLVAWYSPIIDGNRFVLGLFLPFLFTVSAVIVALAPRLRWTWKSHPCNSLTLFNAVLSVWIAVEIAVICLLRIPGMYGGS